MMELYKALWEDLASLGVDISKFNAELILRSFSSTYYGRYYPREKHIVIYVFATKELLHFRPYRGFHGLLETFLHEAIHAMQYQSGDYQRTKGVMHDPEFYRLYNKYSCKLQEVAEKRELRLTV